MLSCRITIVLTLNFWIHWVQILLHLFLRVVFSKRSRLCSLVLDAGPAMFHQRLKKMSLPPQLIHNTQCTTSIAEKERVLPPLPTPLPNILRTESLCNMTYHFYFFLGGGGGHSVGNVLMYDKGSSLSILSIIACKVTPSNFPHVK